MGLSYQKASQFQKKPAHRSGHAGERALKKGSLFHLQAVSCFMADCALDWLVYVLFPAFIILVPSGFLLTTWHLWVEASLATQ
jgi:hypothetical protein